MGRLILPFFIFLIHYQVAISTSFTSTPHLNLCTDHNSLLLLQFKQNIKIDDTASLYPEFCGQRSYPKTTSWNRSTDCCMWDGVTCDEITGEVIGLDLSCSQLQGVINSNTTLFQLSHLQTLNLAYNDFSSSLISSKFGGFQSLTHLNLSNSGFSGPLPSEFLRLFNLMSLDLSFFNFETMNKHRIVIHPHIFQLLLQNLTQLRQVSLTGANIASVLPHNLSASLKVLVLEDTHLFGEPPVEIFQLPNLEILQLGMNVNLTGNLLQVQWNTSSALYFLDLSDTGFSGELPESIGNLKSLYHLGISFCRFTGSIPESLGNLTQMTFLNLGYNNLTGQVPTSLANLEQLIFLDLSSNSLTGTVPNFFDFKNLTSLDLSVNLFNGYFPSSVINLTNLEWIDLSYNALTGPLPPNISGFPNLVWLYLGHNSFNSTIPSWVFKYQSLQKIDVSYNKLHGPIPKSISKLVNLTSLDLSYNHFSVEVSLFSNLERLQYLDLSFNSLSITNKQVNPTWPSSLENLYLSSCGVKDLDFLDGANNLHWLDLSDNMLHGQIFTDEKSYTWAQNLYYLNLSYNFLTDIHHLPSQFLYSLDLRSNLFNGPLIVPSVEITYFFASDNNFSGEIPLSICNLSYLVLLDLSNNNLSGVVPQCLGNVSTQLWVLDLHMNNFHGIIPSTFSIGSQLRSFNLRNNMLEGTIPQSLSNCRELQVVDMGNNNLNGTFPWWLGTLPKLQVLSLRTNHLFGPLTISKTGLAFPALRILDLSQNEFKGFLPARFFRKLGATKMVDRDIKQLRFKPPPYYHKDSVMVTTKGLEMDVVSVLSILTTIDLSSNKFGGAIPDVIGNLISLQGLNLSHNTLTGRIPPTLRNLTYLESLDLSSNQLEGEIPTQLTALTFLSVLNLSQNHLTGSIPRGHQFDTFDNTSYLGNDGLCGVPLSKACDNDHKLMMPPPLPALDDEKGNDEDLINGFTWQAVLIGYGCGMVIGVSMGYVNFITQKPRWFNKFVEGEARRLM